MIAAFFIGVIVGAGALFVVCLCFAAKDPNDT
jgi:hypothetical protein